MRVQLYTVPGQVRYGSTRKMVLKGVDGLVFVADSMEVRREKNMLSLKDLHNNLKDYGLNIFKIPLVMQYNKRDLPNILSFEELENDLNKMGFPSYEAVATEGRGVFASLKSASNAILESLQ